MTNWFSPANLGLHHRVTQSYFTEFLGVQKRCTTPGLNSEKLFGKNFIFIFVKKNSCRKSNTLV
ncbi:MAG TPA: hypothetical protein DCQ93_04135 [Bacteroidetes bacterium]|nr:hypothetical protein [Bacteroidota bacterium]